MSTALSFEDDYVCGLETDILKIAKDELNEDENIRKQALDQFRVWVSKQTHIRHCRTDAVFFLRFLRPKKFNIEKSGDLLERYLSISKLYPQSYSQLDCKEPVLWNILTKGYIVPLTQQSAAVNNQIILCDLNIIDMSTQNSLQHYCRVQTIVFELLLELERNQICGFSFIVNMKGLTLQTIAAFPISEVKYMTENFYKSNPMRIKEVHFINVPTIASVIVELIKSCLSEKIRKRFFFHSDDSILLKRFDKTRLPKEYGGNTPIAEMITAFTGKLSENRERIKMADSFDIDVTKAACYLQLHDSVDMEAGAVGSFRKLNVD